MKSPADYTNATFTTAQQVRDYVNLSNQSYDVKLELLSESHADGLTAKNSMPDGTNDLSDYCIDCALENNASADVQRTCTLTLDGKVASYIDASADRVKVSIEYYNSAGSVILGPIPMGIFLFQSFDITRLDNGNNIISANLVDDIYTLTQIEFLADYAVPQGVDPMLATATILKMDAKSPSEGGRTPDGTAVSGGPVGNIPTPGTYTMMGVLATTVTTFNAATGFYESADHGFGVVQYSPYDHAHCDPTTFAPISPFNGHPMIPALIGHGWWNDDALFLYFKPSTGEFSLPVHALADIQVVDPYKNAPIYSPYPSGFRVKQVNPASVLTSVGTLTPPLSTWPYDYDGSGPFWVNTTAQPVTTVGSGLVATLTGQPVGGFFLLASRTGQGITTVIPPGAYYAVTAGAGSTDPANPGTIWQLPPTSIEYNIGAFGGGWSWSGGVWTVTLNLSGGPNFAGSAHISCTVYERDNIGTYFSKGTLTGSTHTWDIVGNTGSQALTCSGTISSFTPGATSTIALAIVLHVDQNITCEAADEEPLSVYGGVNAGFPAPNLPDASTYTDYGNPASGLTATGTGTHVPWPDTNDPGQAPSGCDEVGRNLPADRISLPTVSETTPATITGNRKDKHLAFINEQLLASANCYPLWVDEAGIFRTAIMPYYTDTSVPDIEWSFTNDAPSEDGYIVSCKQTVWDSDNVWNIVLEVAEPNGKGVGLFTRLSNDDADSIVSRAHQGRPITHVEQNDALTSQDSVNEAANLAQQEGSRGIDSLECVVPMNPFFGMHDVVNVRWKDQSTGEYVIDGSSFPYIVTDWKMTLRQGDQLVPTVQFTAQRVVQFT